MPSSRRIGAGSLLISLLPLTVSAVSYSYTLQDTYAGNSFYDGFTFFTDPDPTHGFVKYVDKATAISSGILGYGQGTAKWGVDDTNVISNNSSGRQSVRLEGKINYNHGLFLADIKHMPGSICGVWPAFWTLGDSNWPAHGELDIIEGVNQASTNQIAAHTADNCTMKFQNQSGWTNGNDCAVSTGAAGCATGSNDATGYGNGFNANGGGVYAMQWTSEFMKVWFFPRNKIPSSISSGSPQPSLDFGIPVGNFDGSSCDIDSHFINHRMIFDTTFCGDWAGSVYSSTSCPLASSGMNGCVNYVANNPGDFSEAYWEVNYIKVFAEKVIASPSSSSTSSSIASTSSSSSSSSSSASSTLSSITSRSISTSSSSSSSVRTSFPSSSSSSSRSSLSSSSTSSSAVRSSSLSSSTKTSISISSSKPTTSSSSVKPISTSLTVKPTTSSSTVKTPSSSTLKPTTSSTLKPTTSSSSSRTTSSSTTSKYSTISSSSRKPTTSSTSSSRRISTSSSSVKPITLSTKKAGVTIRSTAVSSSSKKVTSTSTKKTSTSSKKTSSSSKKISTSSLKTSTLKRTTSSSTKKLTSTTTRR